MKFPLTAPRSVFVIASVIVRSINSSDHLRAAAGEVHDPIVLGAPLHLAWILPRGAGDEDALRGTDHRLLIRVALLAHQRLQRSADVPLHFGRCRIRQTRGRCSGARAVLERERHVEAEFLDEPQRRFEVLVRFAGESDDEIRRERHIGTHRTHAPDLVFVFENRVVRASSSRARDRSPTAPAGARGSTSFGSVAYASMRLLENSTGCDVV